NTEEEKKEAFVEMLKECEVTSTTKWPETQRYCESDPRWELLKRGSRRQIWTEYQNKRRKEEAEEKRSKAKKARMGFMKMLAQNTQIDGRSRWDEAERTLRDDARFKAVPDSADREDLFNEFVEALTKKEKEDRRAAQKLASERFVEFLEEEYLSLGITFRTTWRDSRDVIERKAPAETDVLEDSDRRRLLDDLVTKLCKAEDERKARERDERRRQDRLRREDFKEFLQGMVEENAITADTTWKDLKRSIEEEDAYKAMDDQPGGARDVFDDIVADLRRQFRDDKRCVEALMEEAKFVVTPETKQLEFEAALLAHEDDKCAEYEQKQKAAKEAAAAAGKGEGKDDGGKEKANGKGKDGSEDGSRRGRSRSRSRSRSGDRRRRSSRSRSRSDSRSRSRSGSRGRGGGRGSRRRERRDRGDKKKDKAADDPPPKRVFQEILDKRAVNLGIVFEALVEKAQVKRKEEERQRERREKKFGDLLEDYFYRSDHVDIDWEQGRDKIGKHSVVKEMEEDDCKRMFDEHMSMLKEKMAKKAARQEQMRLEREAKRKEREEREKEERDRRSSKRGRSSSRSYSDRSYSRSRSRSRGSSRSDRRSRSRSVSRSRSLDSRDRSRDRKHHSSSHKKSKKRHRSRSPDSPYQSYSAPVEKHKKEKKKSKKNKKDKKDKRDKDKDRHSSKHGDKDSKDKHASTTASNSRKDSMAVDSADDEEGQVDVNKGKKEKENGGEGASPATKRPRVGADKEADAGRDGSPAKRVTALERAHKVEENGNGSAPVPL
ncbi:unnamed protein product, partial [Ectocarpus sp. 13 AM-2016]